MKKGREAALGGYQRYSMPALRVLTRVPALPSVIATMSASVQDGAARHRLVHAGAATMALPWALAFRNKARTR